MDRERLRQRLNAFEPTDDIEGQHKADMLALCDAPGDLFRRDHFDPGHITASAFVLSPDLTDLLLIFHGKLDRWLQPGGHVEASDTDIVAACRREVAEETGLTELEAQGGVFDLDVHVIPPRKSDPAHNHFDVRLLFRALNRSVTAGSDAKAARWVPLEDISGIESDESVMRAVRKIAARR